MQVTIDKKRVRLSNLDKVMYPASGFTKGQVIEYYAHVANVLLPHLADRPISLKRYPDGVEGKFFYQKNCPSHRPQWLHTVEIPRGSRAKSSRDDEMIEYCTIDDQASLIWTVNTGSLELHTHLYAIKDIDRPTMMVFDLDPGPGADLLDCLRVACDLRSVLDDAELRSMAKTSGGKGLHLAVPLNTPANFDDTKSFARSAAERLARDDPKRVTANMRKELRKGRVFVDWSQNDRHKTTVCAYSLRAQPRPTVSTPVTWDEIETAIDDGSADALVFEAGDALQRIDAMGDLFGPVLTVKQRLP